ncbi:U6 small nuclear RNA (adenine-(43)-N(6))-methyltransferase [Phytophthora citrophthora]|uniref:U6 small nuclear RNA (Adenine-(43)-N(6))-methyltransferase n=1 Tax=Phytophthora citrophthora TaxID=4793 RepID=A0AAD9GAW8_9STRA|nr:U6 small nuclear RNA (adenine-(43)-N(6))-methyltransferase [Phytophthora citrophthora]
MDVCVNVVSGAATADTTKDERCILYSSAVPSTHKFVRVSSGPCVAFTELRRQKDGTTASFGLLEALELSETHPVELQVSPVADNDTDTDLITCKCKFGAAKRVRLCFRNRTRCPGTVFRGLQRIASRLLDGVVVWSGKKASVDWLNRREAVEFVDVEWESTGTGCCSHLGVISSATTVELAFVETPEVLNTSSFKSVDVYVEKISMELGGIDKYARTLLQAILQRLDPNVEQEAMVAPSVGALVSGLPGIGKTALAKAICRCLGVTTVFLNAADIFQTYVGQSEKQLVSVFENAVLQSPSILLIDGIEAIAGNRRVLADSQSALEIGVLGALLASLEKIKAPSHRMFVLATTTQPGQVDAAVLSNGRIDKIVNIEPPTQAERLEILQKMTKSWQTDQLDGFMNQVSESTGGFVGADLLSLCQRALQVCLNESAATKTEATALVYPHQFEKALAVTYPSVLQTHHVSQKQRQPASTSIQKTDQSTSQGAFSGIFGMNDASQTLRVSLIEPLEDCSRFLRFGTTPPKGILLTGPPGSGKTHLANAVAEEVRRRGLASFVSVQCSDLLTKVVGDTEKALRELFATARNAAPCVLYFDQIESIAPLRGFDTSTEQTFDRMLSMLLVEMDGFSTSRIKLQRSLATDKARMAFLKQHVVILASTTNKELLDPAILRPGRFDVHINVTYPDEEARTAIILQALEKVPVDFSGESVLNSREALARHMAKHTNGLSAGDLNAILREAAMASMRNNLEATSVAIKYVQQALGEATSSATTSSSNSLPLFASRQPRKRDDSKRPGGSRASIRSERRRPTPQLGANAHHRNRYKDNPPDFYALGMQYPEFKQYLRNVNDVKCRASLAWDDPFAVRELTKTLLLHDFGLQWDIPINRLCPPLPNRLNYLHWIEDLITQANWIKADGDAVSGIDIGTGANCIYALLGATMNKWKFIATEIDAESFECAKENVARNQLEKLISVKRTHTDKLLLEPLQDEPPASKFQFVMCNPPFFDNMSEADTNPDSSCMGSVNEMVYPGGEVTFIGNMIRESEQLQDRVLWFTSMVGKKSSVRKLLALLRGTMVHSTRTTEFFQGRTKRWGIAWTFSADVLDDPSAKVLGKRKEAHRRQELSFQVPLKSGEAPSGCASKEEVLQRVREFVCSKPELRLSMDAMGEEEDGDDADEMGEGGGDGEDEDQNWLMYRLEQHKMVAGAISTEIRCAGRVEIDTLDEKNGFEVLVAFEEGERAAFWALADLLQAATLRTGRQWRRKLQRQ